MKKVYVLCALLALLLSGSTVYAQNRGEDLKSEKIEITDENRYDPVYFQEPEEIYPVSSTEPGRAGANSEVTIEEYIVNALENFQVKIDISSYRISTKEALDLFVQILNNNPQLFYLKANDATVWSYSGIASYYEVEYSDTVDNIKKRKEEFAQAADKLIEQIDSSFTDLEKALVIHDQLVLKCEYDYQNYLDNKIPADSYTAYGALVNGTAVCQGYAEAYDYIMENRLGISCDVVSSDTMNHAWNMISIDGKWYHVDATWDDPVWDSIGRVVHTYFMLSDTAISDSTRKHTGWVTDHNASSTLYDNGFWSDIQSGILYHEGEWYYSRYQSADRKISLVKKNALLDGQESQLYTVSYTEWNNYPVSYMFLTEAAGDIYFNTGHSVYKLEGGSAVQIYSPTLSGSDRIFGFTIKDGVLRYALQETPNLESKQQILTHKLIQDLTGVSAADVTAVYDGGRKEIQITGTVQGDKIFYMGSDGAYGEGQPEMIRAGSYQVQYKVERKGYMPYYGVATVKIEKADPVYIVPSGLTGVSGSTLGSVRLPSGFVWEDSSTALIQEGTYTYSVKYVPEDTDNYKEKTGISVEVSVKCPGHKYTSEITKEPTATEKGERIYTCSICRDSYKEQFQGAQTLPEIEGISAENIKAVYNGGLQKIQIKGTVDTDRISYALDEGSYTSIQPEMRNAGTYEVSYKVERTGYQNYYGRVKVIIEKADPEYREPSGLTGTSGKTLGDIELPSGFIWESDAMTELSVTGIHTFFVEYQPADIKNYNIITEIPVKVEVICPGHEYRSEIEKEPTETEKGTEVYTCIYCGDTYRKDIDSILPAIQGISAAPIIEAYDGFSKEIRIEGLESGDVVAYALDEGAYGSLQPEMRNAGTYQVSYRVERSGHRPFYGKTDVRILKARPEYETPSGLRGNSGETLGDIQLPRGFEWQSAPSTELFREGTYTYMVKYVPEDMVNYEEIPDIEVEVTVECPEHEYFVEIVREPTETEEGERIFTCMNCGHTYSEEIEALGLKAPERVSGLKVSRYSANTLQFSWKKGNDISYELTLYKGSRIVNRREVRGSSYTYKKLQSATVYTLEIIPFREVGGDRVYGSASSKIKTATAPGKPALSSVKKSGSKNARLKWKKVSGASGYEVYMRTGKGAFKKVRTVTGGSKTSYIQKGLKKGKTYTFRIRAYKAVGSRKMSGSYSTGRTLKIRK